MRLFRYWLPPILWMVTIFLLSSNQRVEVSPVYWVQFTLFKSLHILEYGFLTILTYRALKNTITLPITHVLYLAFIISVWYGMTDEIHQVFVPTREGRMRDIFIDSMGAFFAVVIIWKVLPKLPGKLKNWAKKWDLIF